MMNGSAGSQQTRSKDLSALVSWVETLFALISLNPPTRTTRSERRDRSPRANIWSHVFLYRFGTSQILSARCHFLGRTLGHVPESYNQITPLITVCRQCNEHLIQLFSPRELLIL